MILERLTLHNFGVYGGRQIVDLAPPDHDRPIVLVGGQNGEGKTTILEAVLLALYGPHALAMIGRGGSYERYLQESIHRGAEARDGASVELSLNILQEGQQVSLRVCRAWRVVSDRAREQLTVSRNGTDDPVLAEAWQDFVETLIPRGVAPLFFFDGERIEALADLERAAATMQTAIGSLLGLDLVDRLHADLRALERRHVAQAADDEERQRLEGINRELAARDEENRALREEMLTAQATADRKQAAVRRVEERLRLAGGEAYEQLGELQADRELARSEIAALLDRLRDLASGPLPFALVRHPIERLTCRAQAEAAVELGHAVERLLDERDELIMGWASDCGLAAPGGEELKKRLALDRERRRPTEAAGVWGLGQAVARDGQRLLESDLPGAALGANELFAALTEARTRLESAESRLAAVPSADSLAELKSEHAVARAATVEASEEVARLAQQLAMAEREQARISEARDRLFKDLAASSLQADDASRLLRHAEKTRETLGELRQRAAAHHMERIEGLIQEALDDLLRKDRLIEEVRIDPVSHEVRLIGRAGESIPPRRLSAGERQLTALSLLWGLARASGRLLPVIIDTPLGRLDSSHRHLLVERYLPHASHQVIVLSTDTEVDQQVSASLNGAVGRSYRLLHDDETQSTTVAEGYFDTRLAPA